MSPTAVEKSFCTTREAARQLGVSVGTVQLWVERGLLQAWKTSGGHRRVLRNSVEGLLHKKSGGLAHAGATPKPTQEPRPMRVMVVEDDANLLRLYQTQISRWPVELELTLMDNAMAALLQMGRQGPDLLITDLHMHGMDGFAMLEVLNKAPEMVHTDLVVVTGLDSAAVQSRGGVPDRVQVLSKPIPFPQLLSIAQRISRRLAPLAIAH